MPRKSKKAEQVVQEPEIRTFQPYTYIQCKITSFLDQKINKDRIYLFMGWIVNGDRFGENAVLMDDRGPFTALIREEDFEVCK